MRRKYLPPPDEAFLAERENPAAKVYAYLAKVPLYATVRIIGRVLPGSKARSHWLGWIIEEGRWARGFIIQTMPKDILDWAAFHVAEAYPDLETATGMTADEIATLKAEQAAKRAKYGLA